MDKDQGQNEQHRSSHFCSSVGRSNTSSARRLSEFSKGPRARLCLGNTQVNVLERQMCCVSDVENRVQSGTSRPLNAANNGTLSSEWVLSQSQSGFTE